MKLKEFTEQQRKDKERKEAERQRKLLEEKRRRNGTNSTGPKVKDK